MYLFPRQLIFAMREELRALLMFFIAKGKEGKEEGWGERVDRYREGRKKIREIYEGDCDRIDEKYFRMYCKLSPNYS